MNEEIDQAQKILETVIQFFVNYSFQIIGGIIVLIAGFIVGSVLAKGVAKICRKSGVDVTLERFLRRLPSFSSSFCFSSSRSRNWASTLRRSWRSWAPALWV